MATDVKRNVEIAINITGIDSKKLANLASSFENIAQGVDNATSSLGAFKKVIEGIKVPKNLNDTVTALKDLSKVKKLPDVENVAKGFERLGKINRIPDLSGFVTELKKFSGIKLPNVKNISSGLKELTDSTLNMQDVGSRLRIVHRNLKRFTEISVPNLNGIVKALKELPKIDLSKSESSLSKLAQALAQFTGTKVPNMNAFVNGFKKLTQLDIGAISEKIKQLNVQIKQLDKQGHLKGFSQFASNLNVASKALRALSVASQRANKAMKDTGEAIDRVSRSAKTFGERIQNYFQYRLIADAMFLLKQAAVAGRDAIIDYDQALKDLQAIMQATDEQVRQMAVAIEDVASKTKFSASETAEGMRILGQAGLTAEESIGAIQAVADLATGTLTDMATSVDLITTALRVFGISAQDSAHVADVFANAVNGSKLTIDKLRTAMNYVGPIAASAGVSLEETAASMMTLANSGQKASTIGTGLRRMLAELVDPSDKMSKAAERAGISLESLDPTANSLGDVLQNLSVVISDTETAFDLFGKRGAAAAISLSKDVTGGYEAMLKSANRFGTAAAMADKQMEGLGVSIKNLQDKLKLVAVALGKAGVTSAIRLFVDAGRQLADILIFVIDNGLRPLLSILKPITDLFGALPAILQVSIIAFGVLALKVKGLATAFSLLKGTAITTQVVGIGTAASTATPFIVTLTTALRGLWVIVLANPITALIAGLAALATAFILLSENSDKQIEKFEKMRAEIDNNISSVDSYVRELERLAESEVSDEDMLSFMDKMAKKFPELTSEIYNTKGSIEELNKVLEEHQKQLRVDATNEAIKGLDGYATKLEEVNRKLSKIKAKQDRGWFFDDADAIAKERREIEKEYKALVGNMSQIVSDAQEKGIKIDWKAMFDVRYMEGTFAKMRDVVLKGAKEITDASKNINLQEHFQLYGVASHWKKEFDDSTSVYDQFLKGTLQENDRYSELLKTVSTSTIQSIVTQQKALIDEMNKAEKELSGEELFAKRKEIQEKGIKLNAEIHDKLAEDNSGYLLKKYADLVKWEEKTLQERLRNVDDERKIEQIRQDVFNESQKRISEALEKSLDVKKIKSDFEVSTKEMGVAHSVLLNTIAVNEQNSVITHEVAEKQKLQATLDYYSQAYENSKKYLAQVSKSQNPEEWQRLYDAVLASEKKFYDARGRYVEQYNAKVDKLNENLAKKSQDRLDAAEDNADKLQDIERKLGKKIEKINDDVKEKIIDKEEDLADEIEDINHDLAEAIEDINEDLRDKLKDIDEEIADNWRKANADKLGIEEDTEDKIRKIRQRGMSDKQKDRDNEKAAYQKLREGEKLIEEARREGDEAKLERGQEILEQAQSLGEGLENEKKAIRLVREAGEELVKARDYEGQIKELDLIKKKNEEIAEAEKKAADAISKAEYDKKEKREDHQKEIGRIEEAKEKRILAAQEASNEAIIAEDKRWEKESRNIDRAIEKIKEKISLYKEMGDAAEAEGLGDGRGTKAETGTAKDTDQVTESAKQATEAIKEMDTQYKETAQSIQQQSQEIADKGFRVIEEDGKKVYTNLTEAQREAFATMGDAIAEGTEEASKKAGEAGKASVQEVTDEFGNLTKIVGEGILIEIETSTAKQKLTDLKTYVTDDGLEIKVEADTDQAKADLEALSTMEPVTVIDIRAKANPEGTVPEIVEYVKGEIESISETTAEVIVTVNKEQVDELITALEKIVDKDIAVNVKITGKDDMQTLIQWLDQLESKTVDVTANVTGDEDVIKLKQTIDSLVNKTVQIIAQVTGLDKVIQLKKAIDELKDKTITITTRYKTEGKKPSDAKGYASGGEVQQYANGGDVFRRLTNPFISRGSGTKDDVPAMLMKNEFVHKVAAVKKYGRRFMEMVNSGTYPIDLAKKAVRGFNQGGFVDMIAKPVQKFASGGFVLSSVMGSLKKRLEEMFGTSDVNLNVDNVNFSNSIQEKADNITSEIGQSSIMRMTDTMNNAVQQFAIGGSISNQRASIDDERRKIQNEYGRKIDEAKSVGASDVADILADERSDLLGIAGELRDELTRLKKEYDEALATRKLENTDRKNEVQTSYDEDVAEENSDYKADVYDDNLDYTRENEDYTLEKNRSKSEYDLETKRSKDDYDSEQQELKDDLAEELYDLYEDFESDKGDYYSTLTDAISEFKEIDKEVTKNRNLNEQVSKPAQGGSFYWRPGDSFPAMTSAQREYGAMENWRFLDTAPDDDNNAATVDYKELREQKREIIEALTDIGLSSGEINSFFSTSAGTNLASQFGADMNPQLASILSGLATGGASDPAQQLALALVNKKYAGEEQKYNDEYNDESSENKREYDEDTYDRDLDYTQDVSDRELDWKRFNEDHTLDTARRDVDHATALDEMKLAYDEAMAEEKKSLDQDLSDYKNQYKEEIASAEKNADESITSRKEDALTDTENAKNNLAESLAGLEGEMKEQLTGVSSASQESALAESVLSETSDTVSKERALTIEELLRKLRTPRVHYNTGGWVPHLAGSIPGKDSIMASLTPGEYVMKESVVKRFGTGFFESLNNFKIPGFNLGGVVGTIQNSVRDSAFKQGIQHSLSLTINDKTYEPLNGSQANINDILNDLALAKMRS